MSNLGMSAQPIATTQTCECGCPYEAHISMMHVMIPCITCRPCKAFKAMTVEQEKAHVAHRRLMQLRIT